MPGGTPRRPAGAGGDPDGWQAARGSTRVPQSAVRLNARGSGGEKKPVENLRRPDYVPLVMLENRDYMRAPSFEPRQPMTITVTLLIVNVVAFLLQTISYYQFPAPSPLDVSPTDAWFALSLAGLKAG